MNDLIGRWVWYRQCWCRIEHQNHDQSVDLRTCSGIGFLWVPYIRVKSQLMPDMRQTEELKAASA